MDEENEEEIAEEETDQLYEVSGNNEDEETIVNQSSSEDKETINEEYDSFFDILDENGWIKTEIYSKFLEFIFQKIELLLDHVEKLQPVEYSVYDGIAGKIWTLFKIKELLTSKEEFMNEEIVERIDEILNINFESPIHDTINFSFLNGISGGYIINAVINKENNTSLSEEMIEKVLELYQNYSDIFADQSTPDDIYKGRAGYLYSIFFLKRKFDIEIDKDMLNEICETIISSGSEKTSEFEAPLNYPSLNHIYLGASRGYVGVLYMLLDSIAMQTEIVQSSLSDIQQTCDILLNLMFPSGNLPKTFPPDKDRLVQWCHGGAGAIYLCLRCENTFRDARYLHLAKLMGDDIWERGLLKKGSGLCHGISGNAYAFLALYNRTEDLKYLYYAYNFTEYMLEQTDDFHFGNSNSFSLFKGLSGILYFLCDFYKPCEAMFPGFQTIDEEITFEPVDSE